MRTIPRDCGVSVFTPPPARLLVPRLCSPTRQMYRATILRARCDHIDAFRMSFVLLTCDFWWCAQFLVIARCVFSLNLLTPRTSPPLARQPRRSIFICILGVVILVRFACFLKIFVVIIGVSHNFS